jgi:hypothetical protein
MLAAVDADVTQGDIEEYLEHMRKSFAYLGIPEEFEESVARRILAQWSVGYPYETTLRVIQGGS